MSGTKKPFDLIGRAAERINIDGWSEADSATAPPAPGAPPVAPEPLVSRAADAAQSAARSVSAPLSGTQSPQSPVFEIDFVKLQRSGYLTPETLGGRLAEEFRLVKRPLLRIASEKRNVEAGHGHVIMVTSAHPGDGKTFVCANLAISLAAERDFFVLAIDGDIRRRELSTRLGLNDRPGIMDVLVNQNVSIADVIVRTNIPNFAVIPAGKAVEGATELFASQRMTKLVHDIASRYKDRLIIFDTPPVLAASEGSVLASHVGQIAFVVNSGETSKRSITQALRLLNVCRHVHFVVNRLTRSAIDDNFGYY